MPTADWCRARPSNQVTNIPGLYAIGECDYQYHGANRLGANSLLSCIFSGLIVAPGIVNLIASSPSAEQTIRSTSAAAKQKQDEHDRLLIGPAAKRTPT